MSSQKNTSDPILRELIAIRQLVQDLVILEAGRMDIGRADVRSLASVADARVSRVWKHVKSLKEK